MNICFVTNRLTFHQLPLCLELNSICNFKMIATIELPEDTENKYPDYSKYSDFLLLAYENEENAALAKKLCTECDVLIYGNLDNTYVAERLKQNKLTFRYSERIFKKKCPWYDILLRKLKYSRTFGRYSNYYLLCASAYSAPDYAKTGAFIDKAYKWGYFPEAKKYDDIDSLISKKRPGTLMWVARFIDWKHPEAPVEVAKRLKADGIDFELNMVGSGDMSDTIADMIKEYGLEDNVHLLGFMAPNEVRRRMEESTIYLFTSDRGEGWGAVLNESMNSACAVVASHAIGSTPFLIKDGENGFIYKDGDIDSLYTKVKRLLLNQEECDKLGKNAYNTIVSEWDANTAANRLVALSERILNGEKSPDVFSDGVCSKAEKLTDNWYK